MLRFAILLFTSALPTLAMAHPGHGTTDTGVLHYAAEPFHAWPFSTIIVAATILTAWKLWKLASRTASR